MAHGFVTRARSPIEPTGRRVNAPATWDYFFGLSCAYAFLYAFGYTDMGRNATPCDNYAQMAAGFANGAETTKAAFRTRLSS
jgi:hypothetical protein